jgi:hypothetical protein
MLTIVKNQKLRRIKNCLSTTQNEIVYYKIDLVTLEKKNKKAESYRPFQRKTIDYFLSDLKNQARKENKTIIYVSRDTKMNERWNWFPIFLEDCEIV